MPARGAWLVVFRRYLILAAGGHFVWELTHLPLYTLWQTGASQQIAWFVVRCTVGDMLIALSSLVLALLIVNDPAWPARSYRPAAIIAVILGIAVTVFSEWFNTTVAATWAYSDLMPVVPGLKVGLSSVAQWLAIPAAGLAWARRGLRRDSRRQDG